MLMRDLVKWCAHRGALHLAVQSFSRVLPVVHSLVGIERFLRPMLRLAHVRQG
jgi:hypothetical protein